MTGKRSGPSTRALKTAQLIHALVAADPTVKVLLIVERLEELDTIARDLKGLRIGYVELRGETDKGSQPDLVEDFRLSCP